MTNKSYSIKEVLKKAILIFDEVRSKIDSLIDCSVKDFEILNSNFKKYYLNLQKLSEASNKIIDVINKIHENDNFNSLLSKDKYQKEKIFDSLSSHLEKLKELSQTFNFFQLILSNAKQDLSTIKLLVTNLHFDPIISTDYKSINNLIDSISKSHKEQETANKAICLIINKSIKFIEEGLFSNSELFGEQIEKIQQSLFHIEDISISVKKHKKHIDEIEKKKVSSTSEIITNLQFQDILRQQIEHVQEAHQDITRNLKDSHREGEIISDDELYKIRDINTLQSAQLIHANREYQKAVETILHKINDLDSFFNQYNTIWNQFGKPESIKLQMIKSNLVEQSSNLSSRKFSLNHLYNNFYKLVDAVDTDLTKYIAYKSKKDDILINIKDLRKIIGNIESAHLKDNKYNPVAQITEELDKLNEWYNKLENEYSNSIHKINISGNLIKDKIKLDIKLIDKFSEDLAILTEYMEELFKPGFNTNMHLEPTSDFSVDQVAYYKTFEKEVQEIIHFLDQLLENININQKDVEKDRLEHLKKLYTMESEREVHKLITGDDNESKKMDDNDDEVEFF
ncbi:MAG: hypothetical protein JXA77_01750 [Bacteroidales bacterium]|nr:hypothetical protein [Bacteroidales bacterium]MBN2820167.1 hypothetical protein [Bacteroidales bacterium]